MANANHAHPNIGERIEGLREQHRRKYADAYAVKFTLELMSQGHHLRALESAELRLSRPCWLTCDIGEA